MEHNQYLKEQRTGLLRFPQVSQSPLVATLSIIEFDGDGFGGVPFMVGTTYNPANVIAPLC